MLDPIAQHIERYMDLLSARQRLVAANVANADTPGYKTRDLDFQSEFQRATLQSTGTAPPSAVEVPGLKIKNDGNNVSVDREARLLAENALRFHMASELMRSELRMVRLAVTEGKNG
jgi:flagellar basal-body rod protein FlgB